MYDHAYKQKRCRMVVKINIHIKISKSLAIQDKFQALDFLKSRKSYPRIEQSINNIYNNIDENQNN